MNSHKQRPARLDALRLDTPSAGAVCPGSGTRLQRPEDRFCPTTLRRCAGNLPLDLLLTHRTEMQRGELPPPWTSRSLVTLFPPSLDAYFHLAPLSNFLRLGDSQTLSVSWVPKSRRKARSASASQGQSWKLGGVDVRPNRKPALLQAAQAPRRGTRRGAFCS